MIDTLFEADNNSTPLTKEETHGLKLKWITQRSELNELELEGIVSAQKWLLSNTPTDVLDELFLRKLHKKMFGSVWEWAGKFRTTERNIGVEPYKIGIKLHSLFEDVHFWIKNKTYPNSEIAVRFHHKLVAIHPFPNGNGRLSRLMADLVCKQLHEHPLNWHASNLVDLSTVRSNYITALRDADRGDYSALIVFTTTKNNE